MTTTELAPVESRIMLKAHYSLERDTLCVVAESWEDFDRLPGERNVRCAGTSYQFESVKLPNGVVVVSGGLLKR